MADDANEADDRWLRYLSGPAGRRVVAVAGVLEGGARRDWALRLLRPVLAADPGAPGAVTAAVERALAPHRGSPQMRRKGLRMLRAMLRADGERDAWLRVLPRQLRREPEPLRRQRHVVEEDCLPAPAPTDPPWLADVLRGIARHESTAHWRTSASFRQTMYMVRHFLRCSGLLDATSAAAFYARVDGLSEEAVRDHCQRFVDALCRTTAAARRYQRVFNLLFLHVFGRITEPVRTLRKRRRTLTLAQLDDILSQTTVRSRTLAADGDADAAADRGRDHFTPAEVDRLLDASRAAPRDRLMIVLLLVTGLRRRGLLNIRTLDIADPPAAGGGGGWRARTVSSTLTKGLRVHRFRLTASARLAVEAWLNTPERDGGRPDHPSPFLFPSGCTDNGALSPSALARAFKAVCRRAGLGGDRRSHLHAMRHTHAHRPHRRSVAPKGAKKNERRRARPAHGRGQRRPRRPGQPGARQHPDDGAVRARNGGGRAANGEDAAVLGPGFLF